MYTSVKQVNTAFRAYAKVQNIPLKRGKPQNEQITDSRLAYCEFVECLHDDSLISEHLRQISHYF